MMTPIRKQIDSYLQHCETKQLSESTLVNKRKILPMFARIIERNDVEDVTNNDMDVYQRYLLANNCNERTVNVWTLHVKAFMGYCETYLDLTLKVNKRRIEKLKCSAVKRRAFAPEEIEKVLQYTNNEREYLLIAIPFESGLRVSELASLRVKDIGSGGVVEVVGKGGKLRETYVTPETYSVICDYAANLERDGYLFPSRVEGLHLSGSQVRFIQKDIFKRMGITNFAPHMLRYSFATVITDNGADLISTQLMLGHSSLVITQRYLQRNSTRVRQDHAQFMSYAPTKNGVLTYNKIPFPTGVDAIKKHPLR